MANKEKEWDITYHYNKVTLQVLKLQSMMYEKETTVLTIVVGVSSAAVRK